MTTPNLDLFWVDLISALWETLEVPGVNGSITTYKIASVDDFPESLSEFPCVITYPFEADPTYSAGGSSQIKWSGVSEFHVIQGVSKSQMPLLLKFPKRIVQVAASSVMLGGAVCSFMLTPGEPGGAIQGPLGVAYGADQENFGFMVNWEVVENITSLIQVGI